MPGYTEWLLSLKSLWQNACSKYKSFLNQYAENVQLESCIWMNGWNYQKKKRKNTIHLWSAVYQHKKQPL